MSLENSERAEWFPPQNKDDEEVPAEEKLSELEAPVN